MFLKSSLLHGISMRTIWQHNDGDNGMTTLRHIKEIVSRAEAYILQDELGVGALMVILLVGLHLPSII